MADRWTLAQVRLGAAAAPRFACQTLTVRDGVTAVIGASGAGKTSLLNLLVGYERPSAGRVDFHAPADRSRLPLFWSPQDHGLWPDVTAEDHVRLVASDAAAARLWLEAFDLADAAGRRPRALSVGMRARLALARAMAADAAVLVLDEPLAHVDAARREPLWERIVATARARGTTLVFATHEPDLVVGWADTVLVVEEGGVVHAGPAAALYRDPPSAALAARMGPYNWFEPAARAVWLGESGDRPRCLRPHALTVQASATGPRVEAIREAAGLTRLDCRLGAETRALLVASIPAGLQPGDCIALCPAAEAPR